MLESGGDFGRAERRQSHGFAGIKPAAGPWDGRRRSGGTTLYLPLIHRSNRRPRSGPRNPEFAGHLAHLAVASAGHSIGAAPVRGGGGSSGARLGMWSRTLGPTRLTAGALVRRELRHRQPARRRWARCRPGRCFPIDALAPTRCRVRVTRPEHRRGCGRRQSGRRSIPGPGQRR